MGASGYRDIYVTNWDTLRFKWSETSQSVADNTTTISWSLQLIATSSGYIYSTASNAWNVTVNGKSYSGTASVAISNNTTKTLASNTTTISHNNDGSKSFSYSFSQVFNITFSNTWIGTVSGSSTGTLTSIPRKATLTSAPDFTDEENPTIKYTNSAGNAVSSLQACISLTGADPDIAYRSVNQTGTLSYTFELTDTEKATLYAATTGSNSRYVYFYLKTVISGNTYYSYIKKKFTIVNGKPTLAPTVDTLGPSGVSPWNNTASLTGNPYKIIKYYGTCRILYNAAAQKGATLTNYKVTCGSKSASVSGAGTSTTYNSLWNVDSNVFNISVTDNRGNTITKTVTKSASDSTFVEYIPLTCNASYSTELIDGTTANLKLTVFGEYFNGSFGMVTNSLSIKYRYKVNDGSYPTDDDGNETWTSVTATPTLSDGKYSVEETLSGLDYQDTYTIEVQASDGIYKDSTAKTSTLIIKITPIFDWGENDFNFNVPVHGAGGITYDIPTVEDGNCNEILTSGIYYIRGGTNKPGDGTNGWLTVKKYIDDEWGNYCLQDYTTYTNIRYRRVMRADAWYDWEPETLRAYPVNSIYISYSHTSPANLFGGSWTRITGYFLYGATASQTIGNTGGNKTITLNTTNLPSHHHTGLYYIGNGTKISMSSGSAAYRMSWTASAGGDYADIYTGDTGSGTAFNIMPPHINVSIWRRTA